VDRLRGVEASEGWFDKFFNHAGLNAHPDYAKVLKSLSMHTLFKRNKSGTLAKLTISLAGDGARRFQQVES